MSTLEAGRASLTVQISRGGVELIEQLAPQWRNLCMEAPSNEPFYRPEWICAYLKAFEPEGKLLLITAHIANRLTAVLPLVERDGLFCGFPVSMLCGAANVFSCRFDLVRSAGPEGDAAVSAIWESLRDQAEWDLIELPDVPQSGAAELLLGRARKDGFLTGQWESIPSPYIPLVEVTDAALVARNSHFRQNLRRRLRKAQTQWTVRLSRINTADPIALQRFYELESSGWKGRQGTAIACAAATRRFYDEIARVAAAFGYFSLYLLEFGDAVVAGHFGLTYQGHYYSPKVAYDESYATYGPGHLLVDAILRDCQKRGLREFDFVGPWMEWKAEWTREVRKHAHCYVFRQGLFGHILYFAKFKVLTLLRKVARHPTIARFREKSRMLPPKTATRAVSSAPKPVG